MGHNQKILNRTRSNQNISDVFLIDNVMTTDPTIIANKFNTFFADIGLRLSESVNNTHNALFTGYLLNPSMYDFTFELITEETTMKILNNLKQKPSCGYDGISTKLLKTCKLEICKSVTLIINQTLSTGIFPDSLKVAKVIPLYKKCDKALFDNYRPISILPSISKIFERIIFNQINDHFTILTTNLATCVCVCAKCDTVCIEMHSSRQAEGVEGTGVEGRAG